MQISSNVKTKRGRFDDEKGPLICEVVEQKPVVVWAAAAAFVLRARIQLDCVDFGEDQPWPYQSTSLMKKTMR